MQWLSNKNYCKMFVLGSNCVFSAGNLSCNAGLQPEAEYDAVYSYFVSQEL